MNTFYAIMIGGIIGIIAAVISETLSAKAKRLIYKYDQLSGIRRGAIYAAILLAITLAALAAIYMFTILKQKGMLP